MGNAVTAAMVSERDWMMDKRSLRLLVASAEDVTPVQVATATTRLATLLADENEDEERPARAARVEVRNGIAVIPIVGAISATDTLWSILFGGTSIVRLRQQFRGALADEAVTAIVLACNSPGGTVTAVPEFAEELYKARGQKPIVAVAQHLACSAAYWLAVQADMVVAAPSAYVGGVGIYRLHENLAGMLDQAGIELTAISFGRYKTEGNWWSPLDDEAKRFEQSQVDDVGHWFLRDLARGRGTTAAMVRAQYGEGRALSAKAALGARMVDAIGQIETVVAKLAKTSGTRSTRALAVDSGAVRAVVDEVTRELMGEQFAAEVTAAENDAIALAIALGE